VPSSYGFLSTFSPTQCGLASFTSALMRQLTRPGSGTSAGVVRVVDSAVTSSSPEVVGQLNTRSADSHLSAAAALNCFDIAVIQHDHGIYGGPDGDQLLAVLDEVRVPVVVVAHTVLAHPTARQLQVTQQVADAADALVTMTRAARDRLVDQYAVDADKVVVIPHGAPARGPHDGGGIGRRPLILTWGLLGPGKGIEWAIDGLQQLRRMDPLPAYVIAGQTHPKVRQQQGEAYRLHLAERARAVGVSRAIRFESSYLDETALNRLVRRADVILVPNDFLVDFLVFLAARFSFRVELGCFFELDFWGDLSDMMALLSVREHDRGDHDPSLTQVAHQRTDRHRQMSDKGRLLAALPSPGSP